MDILNKKRLSPKNIGNQIIGLQSHFFHRTKSPWAKRDGWLLDGNGVFLVPRSRRLKWKGNSGDDSLGEMDFICAIQLEPL